MFVDSKLAEVVISRELQKAKKQYLLVPYDYHSSYPWAQRHGRSTWLKKETSYVF